MRKIDKAVEIVRGWSDEELHKFLVMNEICPLLLGLSKPETCINSCPNSNDHMPYMTCWNEEVENE